jgi:hypothetical protein
LPPLLSTAKCVSASQWPREGCRCTSTAPARSAQRSLCPSRTGHVPLPRAAPRSAGHPGSSRRRGRWVEPGPAGRLSLSLSLLSSGVGVVLASRHRDRRCNRIAPSRSCGSAGAAVRIEVGSPSRQSANRSAASRFPLPRLVERPSGSGQEGRSAQWHACTGDLCECEYMCFGKSGMCLWLAFAAVGHGEAGRLST